MMNRRELLIAGSGAACASFVSAQTTPAYPTKPIRLVVPYPAGIAPDVIARILSPHLQASLGQPLVIENRPGAAGMIGADNVAKSQPDGHTLFMAVNSIVAINPHVYRKMTYNGLKDFAPITQITRASYALIANNNFSPRTVPELVALAQSKPGTINYATPGVGSAPHVIMSLLAQRAGGVDMRNIPFLTTGLTEVTSGQVDVSFEPIATAVPFIKAGRVRAIAVCSPNRLPALPDVPTVAEYYPGFDGDGWHGIMAPAKTPREIIARLNVEFVRAIRLPEVVRRLEELGLVVVANSPEAFGAVLVKDYDHWGKVVKAARISVD